MSSLPVVSGSLPAVNVASFGGVMMAVATLVVGFLTSCPLTPAQKLSCGGAMTFRGFHDFLQASTWLEPRVGPKLLPSNGLEFKLKCNGKLCYPCFSLFIFLVTSFSSIFSGAL